jgi:hypothetical protein
MSKQMLCGAPGAALVALVAAMFAFVTPMPAAAQVETVKPKVMESGVAHPHSAIYIGQQLLLLQQQPAQSRGVAHPRGRPQVSLPLHVSDDQRLRLRLA